jgi:hypothetical protein
MMSPCPGGIKLFAGRDADGGGAADRESPRHQDPRLKRNWKFQILELDDSLDIGAWDLELLTS